MVVLDSHEIPDFDNIKDEEMEEFMKSTMPQVMETLKSKELFKTRFIGLMDNIKDYCKYISQ